jgi:hypothetical protein
LKRTPTTIMPVKVKIHEPIPSSANKCQLFVLMTDVQTYCSEVPYWKISDQWR